MYKHVWLIYVKYIVISINSCQTYFGFLGFLCPFLGVSSSLSFGCFFWVTLLKKGTVKCAWSHSCTICRDLTLILYLPRSWPRRIPSNPGDLKNQPRSLILIVFQPIMKGSVEVESLFKLYIIHQNYVRSVSYLASTAKSGAIPSNFHNFFICGPIFKVQSLPESLQWGEKRSLVKSGDLTEI